MDKNANNFKYVYEVKNVLVQERMLMDDIAEFELQPDPKREVDRYIYKYMSNIPSNIEKVLKIVNVKLLPEDLQAVFKQAESQSNNNMSDTKDVGATMLED